MLKNADSDQKVYHLGIQKNNSQSQGTFFTKALRQKLNLRFEYLINSKIVDLFRKKFKTVLKTIRNIYQLNTRKALFDLIKHFRFYSCPKCLCKSSFA